MITQPSDQPTLFGIVVGVLPYIFLLWIFFALFRNMRGQGNSIFKVGENKAKLYDENQTKVTFADVAGLDGLVELLEDREGGLLELRSPVPRSALGRGVQVRTGKK